MTYRQIGPEDGSYEACQYAKKTPGRFMCDAVNHSSKGGCPNPDCWLHQASAPDDEPSPAEKRRGAR